MFCSAEWQSSRLHEYEFGIKNNTTIFGKQLMALVRSVLAAISLFPDADALMNFVEQIYESDDVPPATMTDEKSQYFQFNLISN